MPAENQLQILNSRFDYVTLSTEHQQALYNLGYRVYFYPEPSGNCMIHSIMHRMYTNEHYAVDELRYAIANSLYNEFKDCSDENKGGSLLSYISVHLSSTAAEGGTFKEVLKNYCNRLASDKKLYLGQHEAVQLCRLLGIRIEIVYLNENIHQQVFGSAGPTISMALSGAYYYLLIREEEINNHLLHGFEEIERDELASIAQAIDRIFKAYQVRNFSIDADEALIAADRRTGAAGRFTLLRATNPVLLN